MMREVKKEVKEFLSKIGRKGGKRSLETMTPEERVARATKASKKAAEVRSKKALSKKAIHAKKKSRP